MTANEAKRARDEYMAGKAGDMVSQINAINALFVMVEELQTSVAARDAQITSLHNQIDVLRQFVEVRADSLSALYPRVAHLESETFGMVQI